MNNFFQKIEGKCKQLAGRVYNMRTYRGEQFYYELYNSYISAYIKKGANVLDIGCQYGRFTIPLANAGCIITATDIHEKFFRFIKKKIQTSSSVTFHKEDIHQTLKEREEKFDIVLCLELLYNLPNYKEIISGFSRLLNKKGVLITSHRPSGYYIYRYIREKKWTELIKILNGSHPDYNCQTTEELKHLYEKAGYKVLEIRPIGMFCGFAEDPFTTFSNPATLTANALTELKKLETNEQLQPLFSHNARYILIIAEKS